MSCNQFKEEDIQAVMRYLAKDNLQNADREYAVQFLEVMQEFAKNLAEKDIGLAKQLYKSLLSKKDLTDGEGHIEQCIYT